MGWEWDETLYAGSAAYYAEGRFAYPPQLADALRDELSLDGTGRLLDIGCGPAPLTRLLAPLFAEAVGIDADAEMVAEAAKRAPVNARFVHMRAEDLPGGLGTFRVASFAQSFHWMDQYVVAANVFELLEPGGACVLVSATTHQGEGNVPRDEIVALVKSYLGPVRRAGRGSLPGDLPWHVPEAFTAAGFPELVELEVPAGQVHERSEDEIVASVYSQSSAAPHMFGERMSEFERELRALLRAHVADGRFHERARDVGLRIWRKPLGLDD